MVVENRARVREMHGVANARRVASASVEASDVQGVTVRDGKDGEVHLLMTTSEYPAGLTPKQARMIAKMLVASAERAERWDGKPKE